MPVQSEIISCPAGQWTSIAQYMESRRSLMIQCPEQATTVNSIVLGQVDDGSGHTILNADPLRKRFVLGMHKVASGFTFGEINPTTSGGGLNGETFAAPSTTTVDDDNWGRFVQSAWFMVLNGDGLTFCSPSLFFETYTCAAIILGINTSTPNVAGPQGSTPTGIWESPDLSSGGTEFRLNRDQDGELVIQEWFAYPVGTGNVNVQIFQSFDLPPIPTDETIGSFNVGLPRLSPQGKMHLNNLLDRIHRS